MPKAPVVSFVSEMNGASTAGWSLTMSGLGIGRLDATPTSMIGISHCLTATWASSTSLVCSHGSGDGVLKVGTASVSGIVGTRTAIFSYDGPQSCFDFALVSPGLPCGFPCGHLGIEAIAGAVRRRATNVVLVFFVCSSLGELHLRAQRCDLSRTQRNCVRDELRVARRDTIDPAEVDELRNDGVGVFFDCGVRAGIRGRAAEGLGGDGGGHRGDAYEDVQLRRSVAVYQQCWPPSVFPACFPTSSLAHETATRLLFLA